MLILSLGLYLLVLLIRANVNIQKTTHGGGCKRACNGLVLLLGEAIDAKRREIPGVLVHPYSQPFDLSRKGRVEANCSTQVRICFFDPTFGPQHHTVAKLCRHALRLHF